MLKWIVAFGLFCFTTIGNAQLIQHIGEQFSNKPKFSLRLDTRNSFIQNSVAKIRGIKLGLDYGSDVTVGMSINWLDKTFNKHKPVYINNDTLNASLDFNYFGFYFEYTFYRNKKWEVSLPVQLGVGSSYFAYTHNSERNKINKKPIIVYEPAMIADYKIWKYVGVGMGVGYRLMLINNNDIDGNFNSPIYVLKLRFYLGDLYRDIFKK